MREWQAQLKPVILLTLHIAIVLFFYLAFTWVRPVIGLSWAFSSYAVILLLYSYLITPAFRIYGFLKWMGICFAIGAAIFFCLYLLVRFGLLQS
jgi:hypothetical protein